MKSALHGKSTSPAEVTNISGNGFWLLLDGDEVFVNFKQFPWFKEASVGALLNVKRPAPHHLHWPELDVDLAVDSLTHPEKFPLVSKERPNNAFQRTHSHVTPRTKHGSRRAARR